MDAAKPSLLLEVLDRHWNDYYAGLKLCRQDPTEEAVHDLRISIRRLASLVDLLRIIMPHDFLQKLRKNLKDQLDDLDELRDTQVLIVEVTEALEALPEVEPFLTHLEKREKRLLRLNGKHIHLFKPGSLTKRIHAVRKSVLMMPCEEEELNRQILDVLDDFYGLVIHRSELLDPARPATIHQMRIAFRKFRYLAETFHSIVPDFPTENFATMHEFQDSMGQVQDIEILLDYLNEFAKKEPSFDPEPVRSYFTGQHEEAIQAFFTVQPKVKCFWRSSRKAAFPWRRRSKTTRPTDICNSAAVEEKPEEKPVATPSAQEDAS